MSSVPNKYFMKTRSWDPALYNPGTKETPFDFLKNNRFPEAKWNLGGAFRFDNTLFKLAEFNAQILQKLLSLREVSGTPACLWTLDWYKPRPLMRLSDFRQALEDYAIHGMSVCVYMDNPFVTDDQLRDSVGNTFLSETYDRDRLRQNAVMVASDKLAAHIKKHFPKLKVRLGVNRVVCGTEKRTADLYSRWADQYDRVAIHPADNVKWDMMEKLSDKDKFEITINDPCLRTCPVRRDHMKALSLIRENPYSAEFLQQRHKLLQMARCEQIGTNLEKEKMTLLLTNSEWRRLYEMGFRRFRIQSESFRNEITFLWDMCRALLGYDLSCSEKLATVITSYIISLRPEENSLPTGLKFFNSSSYE